VQSWTATLDISRVPRHQNLHLSKAIADHDYDPESAVPAVLVISPAAFSSLVGLGIFGVPILDVKTLSRKSYQPFVS
jgi:hypothetical protein